MPSACGAPFEGRPQATASIASCSYATDETSALLLLVLCIIQFGRRFSVRIHTRRLTRVNVDFRQTMQVAAFLSGTQIGDGSMTGDCFTSTVTETCTSCQHTMKYTNEEMHKTIFLHFRSTAALTNKEQMQRSWSSLKAKKDKTRI